MPYVPQFRDFFHEIYFSKKCTTHRAAFFPQVIQNPKKCEKSHARLQGFFQKFVDLFKKCLLKGPHFTRNVPPFLPK